jgi:hypothetical protein
VTGTADYVLRPDPLTVDWAENALSRNQEAKGRARPWGWETARAVCAYRPCMCWPTPDSTAAHLARADRCQVPLVKVSGPGGVSVFG